MNSITRWNPFRSMTRSDKASDSSQEDMGNWMSPSRFDERNRKMLALDVHETDKEFIVTTALPGAKPEDIQVKVQGDLLTIRSESSESSKEEGMQRQFYSSYERSIRLPQPIDHDKVEAEYENGGLRLTLPKTAMSEGQSIPVKSVNQKVPVKGSR